MFKKIQCIQLLQTEYAYFKKQFTFSKNICDEMNS